MKMINTTKNYIFRAIFLILTLIWMIVIFIFSNQPSKKSEDTSSGITRIIVEILNRDASIEEKQQKIESLDPYIRKLAHFTIYAIGGCVIFGFINTYNLANKNKILYSISIGAIYACTDEIHQIFVDGRSGELRDVLIDTSGAMLGTVIFILLKKFFYLISVNI